MNCIDYKIQDKMSDPIEFIAKYEAETMYYYQATKKPEQNQLRESMVK